LSRHQQTVTTKLVIAAAAPTSSLQSHLAHQVFSDYGSVPNPSMTGLLIVRRNPTLRIRSSPTDAS